MYLREVDFDPNSGEDMIGMCTPVFELKTPVERTKSGHDVRFGLIFMGNRHFSATNEDLPNFVFGLKMQVTQGHNGRYEHSVISFGSFPGEPVPRGRRCRAKSEFLSKKPMSGQRKNRCSNTSKYGG